MGTPAPAISAVSLVGRGVPEVVVRARDEARAWSLGPSGLVRVLPEGMTAAGFHDHVTESARAWSSFACAGTILPPAFAMTVLGDLTAPVGYFEGAPNINTVAFRDHWGDDAFHAPDAAAITIVTFTSPSARILDADTELNLRSAINPRGFVFATDGRRDAADLPTIVTHELGHTQGLAHSSERSSVMWYSAGRGEQRRGPDDAAWGEERVLLDAAAARHGGLVQGLELYSDATRVLLAVTTAAGLHLLESRDEGRSWHGPTE